MVDLEGEECVGALDLAAVNDYCSFTMKFNVGGRHQFLWRFYIPEDKYRQRYDMQRENANIDEWVRKGYITVTPGNVTDYDYIITDIAELSKKYKITAIAYDPWNSSSIVPKLVEQGAQMHPFTQTISNYAMPTKEFERLVGMGAIDHYNNPVARWMLSNVVIREDANGNKRPDKAKSSEKIDGIVAAIMALGQAMSDKVESQHVYERRGILGFDDDDNNEEEQPNNLFNYDDFNIYSDNEY
jgi:phage terminase large subunit-like protein